MTTPRFANSCSQRTCVDKWRMVPTPSRLHLPRAAALSNKNSVRTSNPVNNKTSRINIASLVVDAAAQYSTPPFECSRDFCLIDAEYSAHPSTSIHKLDWLLLSLTFPTEPLSDQTRKKCTMRGMVCSKINKTLTGPLPNIGPIVSIVSMKLLSVPSSPSHKLFLGMQITTINWQILQFPNNSTVESALLHVQNNTIVKFMFDGSSCAWRWCLFAMRQHRALQHYSEKFWVGHNLNSVVVQHSLTFENVHTSFPLHKLSRFWNGFSVRNWFGPSPTRLPVECHGNHPCVRQWKQPAQQLQRIVALHHICRNSALSMPSAMQSTQRVPTRLGPYNFFAIAKTQKSSSPMRPAVFFVLVHVEILVGHVGCE